MAAQWPCVCLQRFWQEVQDQKQHQQTQEAISFQASPQEQFLQLLLVEKGGRIGKGLVCPAPGRGQTFSTISVGNILFTFFKHKIV